jgi:hypothetical protein
MKCQTLMTRTTVSTPQRARKSFAVLMSAWYLWQHEPPPPCIEEFVAMRLRAHAEQLDVRADFS